jgi:hypothetical protein
MVDGARTGHRAIAPQLFHRRPAPIQWSPASAIEELVSLSIHGAS